MKFRGCVFNIQRYSIHDGPGIRTTVFLKGCPLRCHWCHNPEGLESRRQLRYEENLCKRCGRCVEVCTEGVHTVLENTHFIEPAQCVQCNRCVDICPSGSLDIVGTEMSVEDVASVVRRDIPFYATSGGGMTLSGGEPLMQLDFSKSLLSQVKSEGIHTALETSALAPWEHIQALLPLVDLFMIDLKHTDDTRHRELTGVSNTPILSNLRKLVEKAHPMLIRIPWVPTQNAELCFLDGLETFLSSLSPIPQIEFMPYHRLGHSKWSALGAASLMPENIPDATYEDMKHWVDRLRQIGVSVRKI